MKIDAGNELLIRRYLLSSISDEEREQVEMRIMTDDDFFQQINLVEDDLVEEYLDGALTGEECGRFEEVFLCSPERQHKLRFAKALRAYAANRPQGRSSLVVPEKQAWYRPLVDWFPAGRPALAYSLLAALLVLSSGGTWLLVQTRGLTEQLRVLQAQQRENAAVESRLRALYEKERARADQMAGLQQQGQEQRVPGPSAGAIQQSFTVSPGVLRSAQSVQTLVIQKDTILVELRLDLAQNWKEAYRAVLLSGGNEMLSRSNLKAEEGDKEITVSFSVAAMNLPGGYCEIWLYGSGESDLLQRYTFRVTRD